VNNKERKYKIKKVKKYNELIKNYNKSAKLYALYSLTFYLCTIKLLMLYDKMKTLNNLSMASTALILTSISGTCVAMTTCKSIENIQNRENLNIEKENLEFDLKYDYSQKEEPKLLRK